MPILTDDSDLKPVYMYSTLGGNGDWYLTLHQMPINDGEDVVNPIQTFRAATSGGNLRRYPEVMEAFVNLCRALEKNGLNEIPK